MGPGGIFAEVSPAKSSKNAFNRVNLPEVQPVLIEIRKLLLKFLTGDELQKAKARESNFGTKLGHVDYKRCIF